ncbi:MAG: anthranilate phosphoribosyltransferase [Pseudomonadota bacterium]
MMNPRDALNHLLEKRDLEHQDMLAIMRAIMRGELSSVQIAGLLVALRCKGESVAEIAAAAEVMRELSTKVPLADVAHLVDTCGTGGDGVHTFNISTASALVAAAAGAKVAKHGGRSVSSTSGSADVLEALGVNVNLTPDKVAQSVREIGVGFMFAPNHHSAMKHAAPVRRELGVRTLFNLLGPLTNPAGAPNQVMGVFDRDLTAKLAEVLKTLGSRHVMVVHAADGMDEISLGSATFIAELKDGAIREYTVTPEEFGCASCDAADLAVHSVTEATAMLLAALENQHVAAADIVTLNAGAAIYVAGLTATLADGISLARQQITSGTARTKLDQLITFTQQSA